MLLEFRRWTERVAAAAGEIAKRLFYSRKSTESAERQVASHSQQREAVETKFGVVDPTWWWKDSCSGTTFNRPGYKDMLDFCRAHTRPKSDRGRIDIYDPSRFARCLDEDGKPDLLAFQSAFNEFELLGWPLHFASRERTGNVLFDSVFITFDAFNSAAFSEKLSVDVRRGRRQHSMAGYWTGGAGPWGTQRIDTKTSRILAPGELSTPGGGGVILMADPKVIPLWERAAKRIVAGASLDSVGAEFHKEGLFGPRGGTLGHSTIKNLLTNRALIGRTFYMEHAGAQRTRHEVAAKWPPIVDIDVFTKVEQRLAARTSQGNGRHRRHRELYPLTPVCAHCGNEYNGGRSKEEQGSARQYTHLNPKERAHPDQYARKAAAGCLVFNVSADELETKIKDLIVRERSSAEFENDVREILSQRDTARAHADDALHAAREKQKMAESKYKALARTASKLAAEGLELSDDDAFMIEIRASSRARKAAERELADAEAFTYSTENALARLTNAIHETRNIAEAWDRCSAEDRATLLGYWVHDVWIVSERIPGMKRANHKTAVVVLRTSPTAPHHFALGDIERTASETAAAISPETLESSSTAARSRSASSAAGVAILPSAQAAWPLTSGSSSDNAPVSAGTDAGSPALPSATATLRKNPRRLVRLIADPLANTRQSSTDMPIHASREGESNEDRALNASSVTGDENLRLYGQTS